MLHAVPLSDVGHYGCETEYFQSALFNDTFDVGKTNPSSTLEKVFMSPLGLSGNPPALQDKSRLHEREGK